MLTGEEIETHKINDEKPWLPTTFHLITCLHAIKAIEIMSIKKAEQEMEAQSKNNDTWTMQV